MYHLASQRAKNRDRKAEVQRSQTEKDRRRTLKMLNQAQLERLFSGLEAWRKNKTELTEDIIKNWNDDTTEDCLDVIRRMIEEKVS